MDYLKRFETLIVFPGLILPLIILLSFSNNCDNGVDGHAIFWEPPSRASLGKHNMNFCKVPVNNNHMSLWCGGIVVSEDSFLLSAEK